MDGMPRSARYALAFEKTLQPSNLCALRGDGCAASRTQCLALSMRLPFFRAKAPHRMKTKLSLWSFSAQMHASVKDAQPSWACEFALCASTVNEALSMKTPCLAQLSKFPCFGAWKPGTSVANSLKMFFRLGGSLMPSFTEKQRPLACPWPWYGSWLVM